MVHAKYLNLLGREQNWYTQSKYCVILRFQHVATADIDLQKLTNQVRLPPSCNCTEALRKVATRLSDDLHMKILDDMGIQYIIDYKENNGSSYDDDSVEPSGKDSPYASSLDGKCNVNKK